MNSTATHTAASRRWLAGVLAIAASAAMLLPGTAAAQEKCAPLGAAHRTTQHWNGVHHAAHHSAPPQPGYGALWYGARPAGGRNAHEQDNVHSNWQGDPLHGRAPQANGLVWGGHHGNHGGQHFIQRVR